MALGLETMISSPPQLLESHDRVPEGTATSAKSFPYTLRYVGLLGTLVVGRKDDGSIYEI